MELAIKLTNGEDLAISLEPGRPLYVVGPNGSGKSALVQNAIRQLGADKVRRISAHRQTWLQSAAINMTAQSRMQFGEQLSGQEPNPVYRWRVFNSEARLSSVLFDLTAMDDDQARRIRDLYFRGDLAEIDSIVNSERPVFERINDLLRTARLEITIENSKSGGILARHLEAVEPYDMAQMSDGERNAVLLSAEVLTVTKGMVLLIDEPERHLNRSIIEPLLSALFAERPDCPFLIATHEIALPLASPESQVLILRSCRWNGDRAEAWDATLLEGDVDLPEDVKRAILGSRRRVLFVEGKANSLDVALYRALFPNISITPVGGRENVIKAVAGLRESSALHEVEAFGLIDGDFHFPEYVHNLQKGGVFALNAYSVESVYFCSDSVSSVAERQAESLGECSSDLIQGAQDGVLESLREEGLAELMAARRCESNIRQQILSRLPTWKTILNQEAFSPSVDTKDLFQQELSRFTALLESVELDQIIADYPIRESEIIEAIVKPLRLNRETYRKTLISRIKQNPELAYKLRERVGPLSGAIAASE